MAEAVLRSTGFLYELYYFQWRTNAPEAKTASRTADVQPTLRILFIGESTIFGIGSRQGSSPGTFPEHLQKILNDLHPHIRIECINRGSVGITTATMLRYLRKELAEYRPDIVVLQGGSNRNWPSIFRLFGWRDNGLSKTRLSTVWAYLQTFRLVRLCRLLYDFAVAGGSEEEHLRNRFKPFITSNNRLMQLSDAEMKGDILAMLTIIRESGARAVLCGYLQEDKDKPPNRILREAARESGVLFCDNRKGLHPSEVSERTLLSFDNWHPNGNGYNLMANNLYKVLIENGLIPTSAGH